MAKRRKKSIVAKCIAGMKRSGHVATSSARSMCAALAKSRKPKRRRVRRH